MLRKIRIAAAAIFFTFITLLFLDFTGTLHLWFGWMAKIQFLPALLALNVSVLLFLVILTLVLGRIYCSVICPLGVMQDIFAWFGKRAKKNRYSYSKPKTILRAALLFLYGAATVAGIGVVTALLAPYSAYGRIASNLLAPLYKWGNNLLAYFAERADSYAFYSVDVWIKSLPTFVVAALTLIIIAVLAWRGGRTYCNTICPVGTVLGMLAKYSWFKPVIDTAKCNGCTMCERNCKASCINSKEHSIDYSRCVACMDCIDKCKRGAISFVHVKGGEKKLSGSSKADKNEKMEGGENGRRAFLAATAVLAASSAVKAQEDKVDGGLAVVLDKKAPKRKGKIVPPGALSVANLEQHCTGCQLCVSACPNGVLRPSTDLMSLLQPHSSYEKGYCRPECTKCSDVCPAGAIRPLDEIEKSSIQIGHAVWIKKNCLPVTDGVSCGKCASVCPVGAIQMVKITCDQCVLKCGEDGKKRCAMIPVVNSERCIGCGACEHLCPSRPFSAIYVEGHEVHREI